MRSHDVARVADGQGLQHMILACVEGGATGAVGFVGLPANLVASTFLFFRAVQSVAMSYGYDVRNDPAEMMIASEVLAQAMNPHQVPGKGLEGAVAKVMVMAEVSTAKQVVKKGWAAMAEHGGTMLLIAQMRALSHAAARKAVEKAGKQGLEKSAFTNVFRQVGNKLTQKAVGRAVPVIGGVIGALFDTGQMRTILDLAGIFYHKRFILEKEARIAMLTTGEDFAEATGVGEREVEAVVESAEDPGEEA